MRPFLTRSDCLSGRAGDLLHCSSPLAPSRRSPRGGRTRGVLRRVRVTSMIRPSRTPPPRPRTCKRRAPRAEPFSPRTRKTIRS